MARWLPVILVIGVSIGIAGAQTKNIAATPRETRVALVIGNAAYSESPLNNPANDARGMARALRAQGFEVIERVNADAMTMRRAVAEFGETLRAGGIGLFYYSGHGMQVNGRNFLIPIGAQIPSEGYVSAETLDVDSVLGHMDGARSRVIVVILDACRNNPFARRFRSQARGLAFMQAPRGTFIAYATSPGDVADDGPRGGYGVFTGELIKVMKEPLKIEDVFKRVGLEVQDRTKGRQTPWVASNLTGDFAFTSAVVASVAPAPPPKLEIKEELRQQFGSLALSAKLDGIEVWLADQRLGARSTCVRRGVSASFPPAGLTTSDSVARRMLSSSSRVNARSSRASRPRGPRPSPIPRGACAPGPRPAAAQARPDAGNVRSACRREIHRCARRCRRTAW
jgi:uncharacterized caspase-like protein